MVLEFGLLQNRLFPESENAGYGVNADPQQKANLEKTNPGAYYPVRIDTSSTSIAGSILAFSPLIWVILTTTASRRTTDGGLTWADCAADTTGMRIGAICKNDSTKAMYVVGNGALAGFTTNSGNNWTASTTLPAYTAYICCSYPTAALGVIGGSRNAVARSILISTDNLVTWVVCTTGPTAVVRALDMYNSTTGFAVDDSLNIWKTTDGGVNWTDTTHNVAAAGAGATTQTLLALSTTSFLYCSFASYIEYYDGTANATRKCPLGESTPTAGHYSSAFVKASNGNIYHTSVRPEATAGSVNIYLSKSVDGGLTWKQKVIAGWQANAVVSTGQPHLFEYNENQLVCYCGAGSMVLIDVKDDV